MSGRVALEGAYLTVEDFFIWMSLALRHEQFSKTYTRASLIPADRRDADLMFWMQNCRRILGPGATAIAHHAVRGGLASDCMVIDGLGVFLG